MADDVRGTRIVNSVVTEVDDASLRQAEQKLKQGVGRFGKEVQKAGDAISKLRQVSGRSPLDNLVPKSAISAIKGLQTSISQLERHSGDSFNGTRAFAQKMADDIAERLGKVRVAFAQLGDNVPQELADVERSLESVQRELRETESAAQSGGSGFKNLTETGKSANLFMLDFSRGIQDVPYGLRGFANNLDPIINNFVRLRTAAADAKVSVGSILKEQLFAAGGILILVNLATTLLQVTGAWDKMVEALTGSRDILKDVSGRIEDLAKDAADARPYIENLTLALKGLGDQQLEDAILGLKLKIGEIDEIDQLLPGFNVRQVLRRTNAGRTVTPNDLEYYQIDASGDEVTYTRQEYEKLVNEVELAQYEAEKFRRAQEEITSAVNDTGASLKANKDYTQELADLVKDIFRSEAVRAEKGAAVKKLLEEQFGLVDKIKTLEDLIVNSQGASPQLLKDANAALDVMRQRLDEIVSKYNDLREASRIAVTPIPASAVQNLPVDIPSVAPDFIKLQSPIQGVLDRMDQLKTAAISTGQTLEQALSKQIAFLRQEMAKLDTTTIGGATKMKLMQEEAKRLGITITELANQKQVLFGIASKLSDVFATFLVPEDGTENRIDKLKQDLRGLAQEMQRAAIKAIILAAALTAAGLAPAGTNFTQLAGTLFANQFGANIKLGNGKSFGGVTGGIKSAGKATFKIAADGQTMYTVLDNYKMERGL